ncbi:MAG: 2-oxoacid:acceptor oxidoreductase family protein [Bacillota bacterium]
MENLVEIRWHARGGQGAKTAAVIMAEAAAEAGKFVQGFPEYGPERMGAPIRAYNRVADTPIHLHCNIEAPGLVVVLDPTLVTNTDVVSGLPEDAALVVNTTESPAAIRRKLKLQGRRVFTVDASGIALDTIGRDIPNTPMMGALVKISGLLPYEEFLAATTQQLKKKFRADIVEKNLTAINRAYQEVIGE